MAGCLGNIAQTDYQWFAIPVRKWTSFSLIWAKCSFTLVLFAYKHCQESFHDSGTYPTPLNAKYCISSRFLIGFIHPLMAHFTVTGKNEAGVDLF